MEPAPDPDATAPRATRWLSYLGALATRSALYGLLFTALAATRDLPTAYFLGGVVLFLLVLALALNLAAYAVRRASRAEAAPPEAP